MGPQEEPDVVEAPAAAGPVIEGQYDEFEDDEEYWDTEQAQW